MKMALAVAVCFAIPFILVGAQRNSASFMWPGVLQQGVAQQGAPPPEKEKTKSSDAACPMHAAHMQGDAGSSGSHEYSEKAMNERGEKGMGFSQSATTHHFLITLDGGVIQVQANDTADAGSRANIRGHLAHIAKSFANGNFEIPMFVHDTVPPGVAEMKRLRAKIKYSFEATASGGRVVISSADRASREAIHEFLRFQIQEHQTGDAMEVR
jgi:hypothetical protein